MKKYLKNLVMSLTMVAAVAVFFIVSSNDAEAAPFFECKWKQVECENGETVEWCLKSGDGNTCECGDETRSCDDNPVIQ